METTRVVLRLIFLVTIIGVTAIWVYNSYSQTCSKLHPPEHNNLPHA